jgi:hypothetical protein
MCGSGSVYRSVAVVRVYECVALFITIFNIPNFLLLLFDLRGLHTPHVCNIYAPNVLHPENPVQNKIKRAGQLEYHDHPSSGALSDVCISGLESCLCRSSSSM